MNKICSSSFEFTLKLRNEIKSLTNEHIDLIT